MDAHRIFIDFKYTDWTYQFNAPLFNSTKDISLDLLNVVSKPILDTLTNSEVIFLLDRVYHANIFYS